MLEDEIAYQKMKGITAEQFQEIETNFHKFDENKNGRIERKELKACLYSLGEEKSNKDIDAILNKYGKENNVSWNGFKEFMTHLLGDADTKEEILSSFKLINRSESPCNIEMIEDVMDPHYANYFKNAAPKVEGDRYDYVKFTEAIFSR